MFEVLLHFASLMLCLKLVREMLGILKMWDLQHYNLKLLPESPWPQAPAVPLRKRSMSSFKDLQRSRHSGLLGTSGLGRSLRFSLLFHLDLFKFHDFSSNPRFSPDVLIPPTSLGSLPRLFGSAGIWASGLMILSKACDFGPIDLSCSRHKPTSTELFFMFDSLLHRNSTGLRCSIGNDNIFTQINFVPLVPLGPMASWCRSQRDLLPASTHHLWRSVPSLNLSWVFMALIVSLSVQ